LVPVQAKSPDEPTDLVVHEWGTFLAMQGSDGVTLDGMYHEEHALPDFVHSRSRDQLRIPSMKMKGETPVIYFYTDKKQKVGIDVRFPAGIWTQWYPQANYVAPGLATLGSALEPRNGRISWNIELLPASDRTKPPTLPATSTDALWKFARDVDAAYIRMLDRATSQRREEVERFIFYRGLGRARLPIEMSLDDGGTLRALSDGDVNLLHLFVVRVENGRGAYTYLPRLDAGRTASHVIPDMTESLALDEFSAKIADDLAGRLAGSGLYPQEARLKSQQPISPAGPFHWAGLYTKEARAMVNTWRTSYFQTDGTRVLFVLPQKWTDTFIPMKITPTPKELVRVMVGRLEVLTPEREKLAENAVRDLASPDEALRNRAFGYLREQGRYVEPIVRRVLATTTDASVRTLCERLLLTDFVTELRTAVNSATNGSRLNENPQYVRAKLASLLRAVGRDDEAHVEAEKVLAALASEKEPALSDPKARHYLRAQARALDGLGDDAAAAAWYGKFIRFASQVRPGNACTGCHQGNDAPRDLAWYRDWWAGRSFAQAVGRAGKVEEQIKTYELAIEKNSRDTTALMMLAYLYAANAEGPKASAIWAKLGVPAETVTAGRR
jgi:tetratricopeptide (TPR) repeat protein